MHARLCFGCFRLHSSARSADPEAILQQLPAADGQLTLMVVVGKAVRPRAEGKPHSTSITCKQKWTGNQLTTADHAALHASSGGLADVAPGAGPCLLLCMACPTDLTVAGWSRGGSVGLQGATCSGSMQMQGLSVLAVTVSCKERAMLVQRMVAGLEVRVAAASRCRSAAAAARRRGQ